MASDTTVRVYVRLAGALPSESSTKVAMPNPLINKSARDLLGEINHVLGFAGRPRAVVQLRLVGGMVIPFDTLASTLDGKVLEALTAVQVRVGTTGSVARAPAPLPISKSLVHQRASRRSEPNPSTSTNTVSSLVRASLLPNPRDRSRTPSLENRAASPSTIDVITHARASLRPQAVESPKVPRAQRGREGSGVSNITHVSSVLGSSPKSPAVRGVSGAGTIGVRGSSPKSAAVRGISPSIPGVRGVSPNNVVGTRGASPRPRNIKWWGTEPIRHLDKTVEKPPPAYNPRAASPTKAPASTTDPSLSIKRRQFADEWRKGYDERQRKVQEPYDAKKSAVAMEARRIEAQEEENRNIERAQLAAKQQHARRDKEEEERSARNVIKDEEVDTCNGIASAIRNLTEDCVQFMAKQNAERAAMEGEASQLHAGIVEAEGTAFTDIFNLNQQEHEEVHYEDVQRQQRTARNDVFVDFLHCHDEVVGEWEKGVVRSFKAMTESEADIRIREEGKNVSMNGGWVYLEEEEEAERVAAAAIAQAQ